MLINNQEIDSSDLIDAIANLEYEGLKNFLWRLSEKLSLNEQDEKNLIEKIMQKQKERNSKPYEFTR